MRELKYRVYEIDRKRYINNSVSIEELSLPKQWQNYFILEEYTGQCLGIFEGQEYRHIFEGDRISALNSRGVRQDYDIIWNEDYSAFWCWDHQHTNMSFQLTCDSIIDSQPKYIGNIHESTP